MSVRINIDRAGIIQKADAAWKSGLPQLTSIVREDCNKYCKMDTGTLIASSLTHSELNKGRIVWQTPYAARQYYEIRTAYKDKNPGASWRWCEVAKQNHKETWKKQAKASERLYR